jgi:hypothetical protein
MKIGVYVYGKLGPFHLPGTVRIHLANRFTRVESRKVIAKLTDSDPNLANEHVVYSARISTTSASAVVEGQTPSAMARLTTPQAPARFSRSRAHS